jgi:hypothetical protein
MGAGICLGSGKNWEFFLELVIIKFQLLDIQKRHEVDGYHSLRSEKRRGI